MGEPGTVELIETRKRGFFGRICKWIFILFNLAMAFWLISYLGSVSQQFTSQTSDAGRAGAAIGTTIGVGFLMMLWLAGDIILGMLVYFTRGSKVIIERRIN